MMDYRGKSYGRNEEVAEIFRLFEQERDLTMPGPRRLGKTFVLQRVEEQGAGRQYCCVRLDVSGCKDAREFFHRLCESIDKLLGAQQGFFSTLKQRVKQLYQPKATGQPTPTWYAALLTHDWQQHFEALLASMHDDSSQRWALLIDELPIFLKNLHDKGDEGLREARGFMNLLNDLRQRFKRVRWLITGSIGLEPLARAGEYFGALVKFQHFVLAELNQEQAVDFVQDLARLNKIRRSEISRAEAEAVVLAVGWRAAFYLDLFAGCLQGVADDDPNKIAQRIDACRQTLLTHNMAPNWSLWEEHLRKHDPDAKRAFACVQALAAHEQGKQVDTLLADLNDNTLTKERLLQHLRRLVDDGLFHETQPERFAIRLPLQRMYWKKFPPVW